MSGTRSSRKLSTRSRRSWGWSLTAQAITGPREIRTRFCSIEDLDAVSDEDRAEYEKEFETSYGITFEEAKESIPEIVSYFFQKTDCNVGENTTWYEAIEAVFGGNRDGD